MPADLLPSPLKGLPQGVSSSCRLTLRVTRPLRRSLEKSVVKQVPQLEIYPFYGQEVLRSRGIKRLIYALVPRHAYMYMRTEISLSFIRLSSAIVRKKFSNSDNLMVNIGAGSSGKPGWINVDIVKQELVNCLYDCRKSLLSVRLP
jgi:hypothetical protein